MFTRTPFAWVSLAAGVATAAVSVAAEPPVQRGAESVGEVVVPYVVEADLRDLPPAPGWRWGDPIVETATHPETAASSVLETAPGGPDPLLERQRSARPVAVDPDFHQPILSIDGQGYGGTNPPDTVGDVGPGHYIQAAKEIAGSVVTVYDKKGTLLAGPFLLESLGMGDCADGWGDPIVLYDRDADRWLLSEFSFAPGNRLCVYVSRTGDPVTGGWFNYDYQAPNFPDYPKYGVWLDAYYVAAREDTPAVYALDRDSMLAGSPARPYQRFAVPPLAGFGFQGLVPADRDGPTPPPDGAPGYFIRHRDDEIHDANPDPAQDFLELFLFAVDWDDPGSSTLTGPVKVGLTEFDSNLCPSSPVRCFAQPGSQTKLSSQREVVLWRLQYRNFGAHEAMIGNFVTDVGGDQGGIRWFELRQTGGNGWSVFQEGTYSIDGADRWLGSIAQDKDGNIALAYNVVDAGGGVFPGLRYSGRLVSDPLGALPQGEYTLIEGSSANARPRYGDYASLNVDPSDDCTFWFTGEYNRTELWSTRIGAFRFDSCAGPPSGPVLSATGTCGGSVTIDVTGATPNGEVGIVPAANANGFVFQGEACPGLVFEIGEPFRLPPTWVQVNGAGSASTVLSLPANRCWVEAIDLASCQTTNAVSTQP